MKQAHCRFFFFGRAGFNNRAYNNLNQTASGCINRNGEDYACIRVEYKWKDAESGKSETGKYMRCYYTFPVAESVNKGC